MSQQHTLGWPARGPHTSVANLLRVSGTGGLWTTQKACLEVADKACHGPVISVSSSPSFAETPHCPTFHFSHPPPSRVQGSGCLLAEVSVSMPPTPTPRTCPPAATRPCVGSHLLPHFLGEGRPLASRATGATPPALREHPHPLPPENCQNEPRHGWCTLDSGTGHFPRPHSPVSSCLCPAPLRAARAARVFPPHSQNPAAWCPPPSRVPLPPPCLHSLRSQNEVF